MESCKRQPTARSLACAWAAAAVLVAAAAVGCNQVAGQNANPSGAREAAADNAPRVQTVAVRSEDLSQSIEMPGSVVGYETAELFAKVGGYLSEISVDIGDEVTKGQVLAQLYIPEMEKELLQKEAAVAAAEADVEAARAAIRQADSQVVEAEAKLEQTKSLVDEKQAAVTQYEAELNRVQGMVQRQSLHREVLEETTAKHEKAVAGLESMHAAIRSAQAEIESAKAGVEKAKTDYQSALARVELANADHQRLKTMADYGTIRAPFDGVVTKRFVDPGAFIQPADGNAAARPLLTVARIDVVRIYVDLPMEKVRWLNRGDRVVFDRINVLPGVAFEGEVTRTSRSLNDRSRMMRVAIDLPNPDRQLLPGYYGYVTVMLDEMPQTPVVPATALMTDGEEKFVYVVENGVTKRRPVSIVFQDGAIVGLGGGLNAGEQVVRAGGGQLREGQQVVAVSAGA